MRDLLDRSLERESEQRFSQSEFRIESIFGTSETRDVSLEIT